MKTRIFQHNSCKIWYENYINFIAQFQSGFEVIAIGSDKSLRKKKRILRAEQRNVGIRILEHFVKLVYTNEQWTAFWASSNLIGIYIIDLCETIILFKTYIKLNILVRRSCYNICMPLFNSKNSKPNTQL